jgi:succinate-semialdehyde dehydrogenase / glutarate-semialdehyde dehydrogenase
MTNHDVASTSPIRSEWGLFIDGTMRDSATPMCDVIDPASGRVIAGVASATAEDAETAVAAAAVAQPAWAVRAPRTRSEIFGPVAPIITFHNTDTMIASVNDSDAGLAAYVYSRDLAKGLRTAERIEAGMVGVNRGAISDPAAPFGGMKASGLGREGGLGGLHEFSETQYIAAQW